MGEVFSMAVTGLNETIDKLKSITGAGFSTDLLVPVMRLVGEDIVGEAKSYCDKGNTHYYRPPHITGDLMRSISYIVTPRENVVWLTIGAGMDYAPWVHEGNGRMAPRPFLTDAVAARRGVADEIMQQGIMTLIRKMA